MKKFLLGGTTLVLVFALATSAWAEPTTDYFWADLGPNNSVAGGGSGWNANGNPSGGEGEWIYYPEAPGSPWWNQWFYDDPPDPNRWKEISYYITLVPRGPEPAFVEVALNWSTVDFPASGPDGAPPMPDQENFIEREVIFPGSNIVGHTPIVGNFSIPDFNPEWVSIDVRYDLTGEMPVSVFGVIVHECVPEPSTFVGLIGLIMMAGLVFLRRGK